MKNSLINFLTISLSICYHGLYLPYFLDFCFLDSHKFSSIQKLKFYCANSIRFVSGNQENTVYYISIYIFNTFVIIKHYKHY